MPAKDAIALVRFQRDSELFDEVFRDPTIEKASNDVRATSGVDRERRRLLGGALKVTDRLMPELIDSIKTAQQIANCEGVAVETYVYDDSHMNAACADFGYGKLFLLLTSAIVQKMTHQELLFVVGHELGHAVFRHHLLPVRAILMELRNMPRVGVSRALKLMSWSRCAEISADRVGLLCCQDYDVATTVMLKLSSGLTEQFVKFDLDALLDQMNEIEEKPEAVDIIDWFSDHPFNPLRVYALNSFWQSDILGRLLKLPGAETPITDVDAKINARLALMEPYTAETAKRPQNAETDCLLWGCLWVAAADLNILQEERRSIQDIVGEQKTQYAMGQIVNLAAEEVAAFARKNFENCAEMGRLMPLSQKQVLIQQMITVAKADQIIQEEEKSVLREICKLLGVDVIFVDRILRMFE